MRDATSMLLPAAIPWLLGKLAKNLSRSPEHDPMTRLFQSGVDCITGQIPAYERELAELAAAMRGHREHDPVRQYQQTVFDAVIHEIAEEARELSDECQKYYIARERHLRLRLAEAQQTHKAARKERRRELQAVSHQPDCQPDSEDALSRARMEAEWRAAQERRTAENAMRDAEQKRALAEAAEARRAEREQRKQAELQQFRSRLKGKVA